MSRADLTQREIDALPATFNLLDGHIIRPLTPDEQLIIDQLPEMFRTARREDMPSLEQEYLDAFFSLTRQTRTDWMQPKFSSDPNALPTSLFHTSASICIEIVANFCRKRFEYGQTRGDNKASVAFIEPCFDNLPNILRRHGLPLEVVPSAWLSQDDEFNNIYNIQSDVIFLCLPNNPDSCFMSEENFIKLMDFCHEKKKVLVIDNCFRAYKFDYDQYALLSRPGKEVSAIMIEDTGKTWPTQEWKAPFIACSRDLADDIYNIHSDLILHLSPVTLKLMTAFLRHSKQDNLESIKAAVRTNRTALHEVLEEFGMREVSAPFASVAWIDTGEREGYEVVELANRQEVKILPGYKFFWSNSYLHRRGSEWLGTHNIRAALTRDPEIFLGAMKAMRSGLSQVA